MEVVKFFLLIYMINTCSLNVCKGNMCFRGINFSAGPFICSDNYEFRNEECFECPFGSTSSSGKSCKSCSPNFHGRRCAEMCFCAVGQRCDTLRGCVNVYKSVSTAIGVSYKREESSSKLDGFTRFEVQRTDKKLSDSTSKPNSSTISAAQRNGTQGGTQIHGVLIYVICSGSVTLIFIMAIATMMYHRQICGKQRMASGRTRKCELTDLNSLQRTEGTGSMTSRPRARDVHVYTTSENLENI